MGLAGEIPLCLGAGDTEAGLMGETEVLGWLDLRDSVATIECVF